MTFRAEQSSPEKAPAEQRTAEKQGTTTAGADVAFAHALLRCGTPEELAAAPGTRLRLTLVGGDRFETVRLHHA